VLKSEQRYTQDFKIKVGRFQDKAGFCSLTFALEELKMGDLARDKIFIEYFNILKILFLV